MNTCISIISHTAFFPILAVVVFGGTVRNLIKCMVAFQSIAKSECSVCYMAFIYADQFFCTGFCLVDGDKML